MTNNYISTREFEDAKNYWLNKLSGNLEEIKIPYGHAKKQKGYAPKEIMFTLDNELDEKLNIISKNSDILLYVYLLTAFKILLCKLSGTRDVCVSSPVYVGQNQAEEQEYNKFIFLRDYIEDGMTFKELLLQVKQTVIDGYKNQYYPMNRIYELLECEINTESCHNVCFHFINIHGKKCMEEIIRKDNYHFIFSLEKQEHLSMKIIFNHKMMDDEYAESILTAYKIILLQVTKDINVQISDIPLVNKDEIEILKQFNDTLVDFGDIKTIAKLFEEQVNKSSDDIAVTYVKDQSKNYEQLTYKELNERANQLAHALRKNGVSRGDIIGLMMHNSLDVAVGILGILKAGGAYMPIEPDYPSDRIMYMARDSNMKLLVTNYDLSATLPYEGIIINLSRQELTKEDVFNLDLVSSPDDPVYMIYTSGTTGNPKGVIVAHKNLFNYVKWRISALGHTSRDVSLQLLSIAFDGFGTNFYPALLSGGSVVFVDNAYWRDLKYISEVISDQKVTNFSLVPLIYRIILENANNEILKSLRFVVLAGEKSDTSLIELSQQKYPEVLLVNEYGPTETTIATTSLCGMAADNISIIGRPIANSKIYILDRDKQLMPIGLFGELCVSGEGVSKGYLNRAELTADKFVKNPFLEKKILYRTGDLARWRQDGTIELLGRIDNQVKIMGYRIEPDEIELVLSGQNDINKTVVTTCTNGAGYTELCAFFTATKEISIEQLRRDLAGKLPEYMIPTHLIQLDEFPLMLNGKIDINTLKLSRLNVITNEYVGPRNDIEKILTEIWEQVLQKEKIGTNDNFFDVGGNSILVMQIHSLIEKVYPGATTIPDYFSYPSISKLAEFIEKRIDKKLENTELYSIELPADYFHEKKGKRSLSGFKLELSSDLQSQLNGIVLNGNIRKLDVILSALVYLFAKITEKENVRLQAMMNEKNRISKICLDVKNLSDFLELFNRVNQESKESQDYLYSEADWYKVNPTRDHGAVLPLFLVSSLYDGKDDLMRCFDIIFEVIMSGEELSLSCEYDAAYLREDKVSNLLQMYMKTLELMLHRVLTINN